MEFYSPINGSAKITSFYGPRNVRKGSKYHGGLDLVPKEGQALGTPVVASAEGKVVSVIANNATYGNLVVIEHYDILSGQYFYTLYAHLQDGSTNLYAGQQIAGGEQVGAIGGTGGYNPHLHFEIIKSPLYDEEGNSLPLPWDSDGPTTGVRGDVGRLNPYDFLYNYNGACWIEPHEQILLLGDTIELQEQLFTTAEAAATPPPPPSCPIVLDLDGDGVETTNINDGGYFDYDGNGFAEQTGLAGADDGTLVRDIDGNGTIDSGKELFGNETILSNGTKAANGFLALADLDSNADGKIDANDTAFINLKVWKDTDGDGYKRQAIGYRREAIGNDTFKLAA